MTTPTQLGKRYVLIGTLQGTEFYELGAAEKPVGPVERK